MLLVTAPSKTQSPIGRHFAEFTLPAFLEKSSCLIDILQPYSVEDLCRLMHISHPLAASTRQRIIDFRPPPTLANSCQAIFTFQGDAYSSLTPEKYTEEELNHSQRHLRILSGLYGILRPLDLIFPYRLEMSCKMTGPGWNNLYQFWGETITTAINAACRDHMDKTVINLASTEYSRTINRKTLTANLLTITFQQKKGDGFATIPIHSKRARGLMIHYLITNRLTRADQLQDFDLDRYRFARDFSTTDSWIFRQE